MSKSKSGNSGGNNRSAVTGRYVSESYAKTHKSTTVTERRPAPAPKRSK